MTMVLLSMFVSVLTGTLVLPVKQVCTLLRRCPYSYMCVSVLTGSRVLTVKQVCTLFWRCSYSLCVFVCISFDGYTGTNCETSMHIVTMAPLYMCVSVVTGTLVLIFKQVYVYCYYDGPTLYLCICYDSHIGTNCSTSMYIVTTIAPTLYVCISFVGYTWTNCETNMYIVTTMAPYICVYLSWRVHWY